MGKHDRSAKEKFDREIRHYFESITIKPLLRLPFVDFVKSHQDVKSCDITLSLKSAAILRIYEEYELFNNIDVGFVKQSSIQDCNPKLETENSQKRCHNNGEFIRTTATVIYKCDNAFITGKLGYSNVDSFTAEDKFDNFILTSCRPIVLVREKQLLISGLSAVLRFLIKFAYKKLEIEAEKNQIDAESRRNKVLQLKNLLGFRGGCLQACAEVSVWTKFCEVDIFQGLEETLKNVALYNGEKNDEISKQLFRLEYHLRKPIKLHNVRKIAFLVNKEVMAQDQNVSSTLKHEFAEGTHMLISDLILFPCVHIFVLLYGEIFMQKYLPNSFTWYSKMKNLSGLNIAKLQLSSPTINYHCEWEIPEVPNESLYKSDKSRYNPTCRAFTKQYEVEEALNSAIPSISIQTVSDVSTFLSWDEIPTLAHPEGGQLPLNRRERKCQQLSSMVVEVMNIVEEKVKQNNSGSIIPLRLVDFCSGGGHVGILLAWLLPKCQIILVENKEESLRRGWERIERLGLKNILLYQCNLDYFDGQFDIGVALHACGTATDLVLSKCIAANASFCVSPCCYGAIRSNHILYYPRSHLFEKSGISLKHYFILAHTADQNTDESNDKSEQGRLCMRIIDSDRCLNAEENAYTVCLKKMIPETASPKNHIVIGVSQDKN